MWVWCCVELVGCGNVVQCGVGRGGWLSPMDRCGLSRGSDSEFL